MTRTSFCDLRTFSLFKICILDFSYHRQKRDTQRTNIQRTSFCFQYMNVRYITYIEKSLGMCVWHCVFVVCMCVCVSRFWGIRQQADVIYLEVPGGVGFRSGWVWGLLGLGWGLSWYVVGESSNSVKRWCRTSKGCVNGLPASS